jgi:hypothetical protein
VYESKLSGLDRMQAVGAEPLRSKNDKPDERAAPTSDKMTGPGKEFRGLGKLYLSVGEGNEETE